MTYDTIGKRIRTENLAGHATTTAWDCCHKVYADGKGLKYDYDGHGQLAKRTWARGIDTFYAYDDWGNLTNTTYSDTTPTIALSYDALGRQTSAIDAAGTTIFSYDAFGANTNETVVGVAGTNILERFHDTFGRDGGYSLNGVRQSTLGYDLATGRLATMLAAGSDTPFAWNYVAGSDLKSSLTYPNGLTASWTYGNRGELLEVENALPSGSVSKYVYTYDAVGRRIGRWMNGDASITMSYDRMGRRVTKNNQCFVYNGYLQVSDSLGNVYVWDYTEPIVTRPLVWSHGGEALFYTHDGNKNVSEVVATGDTLAAHYEYAPFGAVTVQTGAFAEPNPWRISGEYADVEAGGIYFNFRNYTPETGRWFARDPVGEIEGVGIYGFCGNRGYGYCDILGLWSSVWPWDTHQDMVEEALNTISKDFLESVPCLRDDDVKDYLLRKIIAGNVGMDSNKDYNRSTPGMLPYHFNRFESEDQTAIEAILLYKKNLAQWRTEINKLLDKESPSDEDCDKVLTRLGELTHMRQDYYGHGVSKDYGIHVLGPYYSPYGLFPYYVAVASGSIGYSQGSPDDPQMTPSGYSGKAYYSQHGPLWWSEPGNRAPDSKARYDYSVEDTVTQMLGDLPKWCSKCCRKVELIKEEAKWMRESYVNPFLRPEKRYFFP